MDVITSLEFERLTNAAGPTAGKLLRPSDGQHPHTVVFVQCVGSRCAADAKKGKEYCSKICCMYTAKHAMLIRDKYPDTEVYVFYIDVRTPGKSFDEFYRRAVEEYGVQYIKGMVGKITPENGTLKVQASDLLAGKQLCIDADLVVLAAAIEPDKSARGLATMLTASMDTNDFFTEAQPCGIPDRRNLPFRYLSGTEGHPGNRLAGECRGGKGHRSSVQAVAEGQSLCCGSGRYDVQRLLPVCKCLSLRCNYL